MTRLEKNLLMKKLCLSKLHQKMTPDEFDVTTYKTSVVTEITRSTTYSNKYVVDLNIQLAADLTSGSNTLFELPYTPVRLQNLYANVGGNYARCFVNSSGQIVVNSDTTGNASVIIIGSFLILA